MNEARHVAVEGIQTSDFDDLRDDHSAASRKISDIIAKLAKGQYRKKVLLSIDQS